MAHAWGRVQRTRELRGSVEYHPPPSYPDSLCINSTRIYWCARNFRLFRGADVRSFDECDRCECAGWGRSLVADVPESLASWLFSLGEHVSGNTTGGLLIHKMHISKGQQFAVQ